MWEWPRCSVHRSEQNWMFCHADLCARAYLHARKCPRALQMRNGTGKAGRWHLEKHVGMGTHTCRHSQGGHCTSVNTPVHVAARRETQKRPRNAHGQMRTRMGHTHMPICTCTGPTHPRPQGKVHPCTVQNLHPTP